MQAEKARDEIEKYDFDLIICSPLKRAKQTAEIINRNKNDEALTERGLGDFEGTQSNFDENPIYNLKLNLEINNIEPAKKFYDRVFNELNYIKNNLADKKYYLLLTVELLGQLKHIFLEQMKQEICLLKH